MQKSYDKMKKQKYKKAERVEGFVISRVGLFFTIWSYLITILCIWSAYVYMYIAAFGILFEDPFLNYTDIFFNFIFIIDMGINFYVDYFEKGKEITIKK